MKMIFKNLVFCGVAILLLITCKKNNVSVGSITNLNCSSATHIGTLIQGETVVGVSSIVPYSGGNGGEHSGQTVNSTGVTGLTATLEEGSFSNSDGTLTYVISGTPSGSGTANFVLAIGGQSCILSRIVGLPAGTITALNCGTATNSGALTQGTAASGVSSSIPYTGGNGGAHSGQTVNSTGVVGLTATLTAGTFASGASNLSYTITGTPASSGTASFALNIGGQTCILNRPVNLPTGTISGLLCIAVTHEGTLTQGTVASGVSSIVPFTGGNGGTHSGQTINSTEVTGLTATLSAGTFTTIGGVGGLLYTITGTPTSSGTARFALNIGGQTCELTRTVNLPIGTISSFNCGSAVNSGTLIMGTPASGIVFSVISYNNGNGGTHNGQTVSSTGVLGLTATLAPGNFVNAPNGVLQYTITGTPIGYGTARFNLSIGGKSCELTREVLRYGSFTDTRDGKVYNTVRIGEQTWMVENLNYTPATGNSWCYDNSTANCNIYGRLYDWNTALTACPSGWHLPSDAEWTELTTYLGGISVAGGKMKSTTGWSSPNTTATNESRFSGLPGGYRYDGSFYELGSKSYWWSSTDDGPNAWRRSLTNINGSVERSRLTKRYGLSCRCVRN
jgi:uncharacterized protein (TIGR02145 family)